MILTQPMRRRKMLQITRAHDANILLRLVPSLAVLAFAMAVACSREPEAPIAVKTTESMEVTRVATSAPSPAPAAETFLASRQTMTPSPGPTATFTPGPTATATPIPTNTAVGDAVPTATAPILTSSPSPTFTPEPTPTAAVTLTVEPVASPTPTNTPSPTSTSTRTQEPADTPTPAATATYTPEPTVTLIPTATATQTPEPEDTGTHETDRAALVALHNATDGDNWNRNTNWLSDMPVGEWYGVTADEDGRVVELRLRGNELSGAIPPELGNLTKLRYLNLDSNELSGEIPPELGDLFRLSSLSLCGNALSGAIPPALGNLNNLTGFWIWGNQLSGQIPPELGRLTSLLWIRLDNNGFTGKIPGEFTALPRLADFDFHNNPDLCAPVDEEFQRWLLGIAVLEGSSCAPEDSPADRSVLVALYEETEGTDWYDATNWLSDQPLRTWSGVTTDADGRVTGLYLSGNLLNGPLPPSLGNLPKLRWLHLRRNFLSGPIPPELGDLSNLEILDISHNEMSGPIPSEVGNLYSLRTLNLYENDLSGPIPSEMGDLSNLRDLYIYDNAGLFGLLPRSLTRIENLNRLRFSGVGVCAPIDKSFQGWIREIRDRQGPDCPSDPSAPGTEGGGIVVRDIFGRSVNEMGIVLVDWEGHIANPAIRYSVELPGPVATLSSSEPRLYFDLPSSVGASGSSKGLVSEDPAKPIEFRVSIFPDRDTSDEKHILTIRYMDFQGRTHTQTMDVHVIDQDTDRPLEFSATSDFRHDETGMFEDPAARAAVQQGLDDIAYFIADMDLDEVQTSQEQMWIWDPGGYVSGRTVTNAVTYTGYLLHVYGYRYKTASAGPSPRGLNQSSDGVELSMKRSGSMVFNPDNPRRWVVWDKWWQAHNHSHAPRDLYAGTLHEGWHALAFTDGHDGWAVFYEAGEIRDAEVKAYYGSYPGMDRTSHLDEGTVDPASGRGGYGREFRGEVPRGRPLVTKLDLLIAQAVGYVLRDTSPFRNLSISDVLLMDGDVGSEYIHTLSAVGGTPAYYWTVDSGSLPEGLSLDSFTGTISGTPRESGTFEFTVRVRDNTEGGQGVARALTLNVRS